MLDNEGKPIDIDINIEELKNLPDYVFDKPLTFEQLNVKNEQELLDKYFNFDYTDGTGTFKREYYEKYTRNPAFIALLIDLGYEVFWGCYAPNLHISTMPFISLPLKLEKESH